jgi:outer membrane protein OmpA-like peptidoglycan-associated protein
MHDGTLHPGAGGLFIVVALSVAACAGIEPAKDEVYINASRHLAEARADPDVSRHARVPLDAAARTLAQTQEAEDLAQLRHLSYLGRKKVDIARAVAETREAEARLEILTKQARAAAAAAKARRVPAPPPPHVESMPAPPPTEDKSRTSAPPPVPNDGTAQAAVAAAAAAAERDAARARRLANSLPEFKVHDENRSTVVTLPEESFPTGSTTLDATVGGRFEPLVEFLRDNADRKVVVNGHTDDTGDAQQNIRISNARAESVKARLVDMGIAETRILTIGYGHNSPIASNDTVAGRRANRRVEIVLMRSVSRSETIPPASVGMAPDGPAYPRRPSPGIGTSP